jgi:hypothetical protein
MKGAVEQSWLVYREKCIPPCLDERGVKVLREAFYAGYYEAFVKVQEIGGLDKRTADQMGAEIINELTAFRLSKSIQRN